MTTVLTQNYDYLPISEKEILRYAGVRGENAEISALLSSCINEASDIFKYKLCYCKLKITICDDECDFGLFKIKSKSLSKNLTGCVSAVIFAATVGTEIDRLIAKYSRLSPSRAVILDAFAAERIEALCNKFSADISRGQKSRPRFSPGYGDMSLEAQKEIFRILDVPKRIGISLSESLIMLPSKSVTAIMGIEK